MFNQICLRVTNLNLLGCDTVSLDERVPVVQRTMVPSSSRVKQSSQIS